MDQFLFFFLSVHVFSAFVCVHLRTNRTCPSLRPLWSKNKQKNPRSSLQDRGLISIINPHRILTPKTVRERPGRSSGFPFSAGLPGGLLKRFEQRFKSFQRFKRFKQFKRFKRFEQFKTPLVACFGRACRGLQRRVRSRFSRDSLRLDMVDSIVTVL